MYNLNGAESKGKRDFFVFFIEQTDNLAEATWLSVVNIPLTSW